MGVQEDYTAMNSSRFEHNSHDEIGSLAGEVSESMAEARSEFAVHSERLIGEVSADLESLEAGSASQRTFGTADTESESEEASWKRTTASDSDSDETSEAADHVCAPESGQDEWPCVGDSG